MKNTVIYSMVLIVPLLSASKCEEVSDVDANSPSSLCDHVMGLCGDDIFDGNKQACIQEVSPLEACRKQCAADQKTCETADECLWWNVGYDGAVDDYCESGAGSSYDGENKGYTSLEECAGAQCASQQSTCQANWECTGVFDDCLSGCTDWTCVEICAYAGYPGGIDDFNKLWTCLSTYCADFM